MTVETQTPKQTTYYVNALIYLGIIVISFLLPPVEPLTSIGVKVLGIFIATVYGWTTCGLVWPSIISLTALSLTGYATLPALFTEGFGHQITLFTFFMLIIVGIIDDSGLSKYIANSILKLKISNGRPWVLYFVFIVAAYIVGTFAALGATLICWNIFYNIAKEIGYTKNDQFPKVVILGIALSSTISQTLLPFQIGPILFFGMLKDLMGISINVGTYMVFTFAFHVFILAGYFAFCKFVVRPDCSLLKDFKTDSIPAMKLDAYQKRVGVLFVAFIIALLLPSFLPKEMALAKILTGFGSPGICALFVALAAAMRFRRKPFIVVADAIYKGVQWDVVFLFTCVFPLSSALTSDVTGVKIFLNDLLGPLLTGRGTFLFSMLLLVFALIVTNFTINIVTGLMVMPIMAALIGSVGANPAVITSLLITTITMAFLTPAASPAGAITYGNTDWLTPKEVLMFALEVIIITAMAIAVFIPLGEMFY